MRVPPSYLVLCGEFDGPLAFLAGKTSECHRKKPLWMYAMFSSESAHYSVIQIYLKTHI